VSERPRRGHPRGELVPDADAMTLLSRALDMARRRLRYRIGAALIVAVTVAAALVLVR
jgi:hypothetical protein